MPLAGIRVLDLGQVYQGPYAGFLLAQAGADVVKVEPPRGEPLRRREAHGGPPSFPLAFLNTKRSVTCDLKQEEGRELLRRLAGVADVLIENFAPGVMDRLGVRWKVLRELNPRLIYASGTAWATSGCRRVRFASRACRPDRSSRTPSWGGTPRTWFATGWAAQWPRRGAPHERRPHRDPPLRRRLAELSLRQADHRRRRRRLERVRPTPGRARRDHGDRATRRSDRRHARCRPGADLPASADAGAAVDVRRHGYGDRGDRERAAGCPGEGTWRPVLRSSGRARTGPGAGVLPSFARKRSTWRSSTRSGTASGSR